MSTHRFFAVVIPLLVCFSSVGAAELLLFEEPAAPPAGAVVLLEGADYAVCLGESDSPGAVVLDRDAGDHRYLRVLLNDPAAEAKLAGLGEIVLSRGKLRLVRWDGELPPGFTLEGLHGILPLELDGTTNARGDAGLPPVPGDDPQLNDIVAAVDEIRIKNTIQDLEDFVTRSARHSQYYQACLYAEGVFDGLGLDGWIQTFTAYPWYGQTFECYNVIAEQTGQVSPDEIYIICGHLDSTAGSPWNVEETAPGADDNASGSVAVLEAARILSQYDFDATLRYICFGAEEQGLCGSTYYANQAYAAGDDILGVINVDMVIWDGYGNDTVWVPYDSQSGSLASFLHDFAADYVPDLTVSTSYDPSFEWSDHSPFWNKGYPALLLIENDYDDNPHYHSTTDLLANYEDYWPFGTNVLRAAVGCVAALADPLDDTDAGTLTLSATAVADGVRLEWSAADPGPLVEPQLLADAGWTTLVERPLNGAAGSWLDREATPGDRRYRLRVSEADGGVWHTSAVEVRVEPSREITSLEVWPVPSAGEVQLALRLPEAGAVTLELYDLAGRRLLTEELGRLEAGETRTSLHLRALEPGVYLLRASGDGEAVSRRLVIGR
ncbi:MAG: M28 family peptidase [Candidatus Coatesbacteria bacterium]|nr:M28 family peptidase [Candidatus Coatesbacteria bacterium]